MIVEERLGKKVEKHYMYDTLAKNGGPGEDTEMIVYIDEETGSKTCVADPALLFIKDALQERLDDMELNSDGIDAGLFLFIHVYGEDVIDIIRKIQGEHNEKIAVLPRQLYIE